MVRYLGRELLSWLGRGGDELIDLRDSIAERDDWEELMVTLCLPVQSVNSTATMDENQTSRGDASSAHHF